MHLTIDGSVLSALFVLAIVIWASGPYVVDLFKGSRTVVSIVAFVALVFATVVTVMSVIR